ncbi:hypothetical protein Cgig2_016037 [Carnegiea gigantea]|uniref:POP1 C-terminal domain-containing protein n=1 Tax=Carnegiea gigantea TaxID=171969 RepID=A0A9Q1QLT1_9CARY|nr:hypothetical protein Cgig2_016037 [Carnegiea gigantea]
MAAHGPKQWQKAAAVPRTLDVRKYAESRAAELDSLHSILSDRLKDDFCSRNNKRRRTTGFKARNRRRPQKPCKFDDDEEKKLPRRVRRRIELKKNPHTGFSVSGDGTRRLRTHVWHAKRFTIAKLWGFYLPLGLHGRSYLEGLLESDGKNGCGSKQNTLKNAEHLSLSTIMLLAVVDPRSLLGKRSAAVPEAHLSSNVCGLSEDKRNGHSAGNMHMKEEELSVLQSAYETDSSLPNCKDLWDVVNEVVHPPVEENVLCLDRQKESLDFFCIKDATSAKSMSTETKFSGLCPIMLLRDTNHTGLLTGYISPSLYPIYVMVGFPYFPSDFPDCNAYSCFMAREAAEVEKKMECCTLDMRFLKVPIPPPWSSINFGFNKVGGQVNGIDTSSNIRRHEDFSADLDGDIPDAGPVNNSGSGCELLVARTSGMLASFLKEVSGDHLLLFPKTPDRMSFSHLMKDEAKFSQASKAATLTSYRRRLCYLRVLLHAYKEGVFDEGAVVCAPRFADLSLCTSRSLNNEVGLQVPHCCLGSYFKQLSSGEWEFQLPADPAAIEAYRQPIGFVTTGFVRGSKRPMAVGFCEAVLLAHLREEQWSQMPAKQRRKEIYVLVRNLRSTAYRLALASIILEEQQEDVKSL